jgi:ABC-type sugar transport system permease subunit
MNNKYITLFKLIIFLIFIVIKGVVLSLLWDYILAPATCLEAIGILGGIGLMLGYSFLKTKIRWLYDKN